MSERRHTPPIATATPKSALSLAQAANWLLAIRRSGRRPLASLAVVLLLFTVTAPIFNQLVANHRYALSPSTRRLVGDVNKNLSAKISYDPASSSYYFNKTAIKSNASPAATLQAQLGGEGQHDASLYSVRMPSDITQGITYYDDNLDVHFKLTPELPLGSAHVEQGRIVYATNGLQDVFTVKGNGLKDDIVLTKSQGDSVAYSYQLHLPAGLQAKLLGDSGELGIYSANPSLYNDSSFATGTSQATIDQARITSPKTNLVFVLPAPVIKQYDAQRQQAQPASASAHFVLSPDGKTLTVIAAGLAKASYPLTIDPSVVTTSTSDFSLGGNSEDGDIDYTTAGQINRGPVTGGGLNSAGNSWTTNGTTLPTALQGAASVTANGYVYEIGGSTTTTSTGATSAVSYALLCTGSNSGSGGCSTTAGAIGTWQSTSSLPAATFNTSAFTYNGYVYVVGGNNGGSPLVTTFYASLNANGTLGGWNYTTFLPFSGAEQGGSAVVYNGYVYLMGGINSGSSYTSSVYYASLNANGTIGSWQLASNSLPTALASGTAAVVNGYIYLIGGQTASGNANNVNSTYYTAIGSNGAPGAWSTANSVLPNKPANATAVVNDGYIYIYGGINGQGTVSGLAEYASPNSDGSLSAWNSTTPPTGSYYGATAISANGYVYQMGGANGSNATVANIYYVKIDAAGNVTQFTAGSNKLPNGRSNAAGTVYNNYAYFVGGTNSAGTVKTVYYAPLQSDGSYGAWVTSSNQLTAARAGATAAAYNGYLYVLGGSPNTNGSSPSTTVYYATLNASTGAVGSWATTQALPQAVYNATSVVYDGYIYEMGGTTTGAYGGDVQSVYYAPILSGGLLGSWTLAPTADQLPVALSAASSGIYNGYIYEMGGLNNTNSSVGTVYYAQICTATNAGSGDCSGISAGGIGTWHTNSNSLQPGISAGGTAISNGYIYEIGGNASGTVVTTVSYAMINNDASVGSWATTNPIPVLRENEVTFAANGYIYTVGGDDNAGTYGSADAYAQVNSGGSGMTGSWATSGNSLSTTLSAAATASANGYIYEAGGYNGSGAVTTVSYAPTATASINNGTPIGASFMTTTPLLQALYGAKAVTANGYLYVIGGTTGSATQSTVYYALLCTGNNNGVSGCSGTPGTIGSWSTSGNTLLQTLVNETVVTTNGYVYVLGGTNGSAQSTVYYATLNASTGAVGSWSTGTALPQALASATSVVANGYVYEIGGSGSSAQSTVYYATLNASTGAVGSWNLTTALPQATYGASSVMANGYVYEIGGYSGASVQSTVYYATINAEGGIGSWSLMPNVLTAAVNYSSAIVTNTYLYVLGGTTGSTPNSATVSAAVYYAPLNTISRLTHYSKLIDLGNNVSVTSLGYNGVLTNGLNAIQYRAANASGQFGSGSQPASAVGTAPGGCANTGVSARYLLVTITMDDSGMSGTMPDKTAASSNYVTDFTVNYAVSGHPSPSIRLRGGQTLQSSVLSSFDTCNG